MTTITFLSSSGAKLGHKSALSKASKESDMRQFTKQFGQMLYRDGPMFVVSTLFAGIFIESLTMVS